jgi:hypothetical protein
VLTLADPAIAHDPLGRAQPSVKTTVRGSDGVHVIDVHITDFDSVQPIPAATLAVNATSPSGKLVSGRVERLQPIVFRCKLVLREVGRWRVAFRVGGMKVVPTAYFGRRGRLGPFLCWSVIVGWDEDAAPGRSPCREPDRVRRTGLVLAGSKAESEATAGTAWRALPSAYASAEIHDGN